jgi:hypothetical protein
LLNVGDVDSISKLLPMDLPLFVGSDVSLSRNASDSIDPSVNDETWEKMERELVSFGFDHVGNKAKGISRAVVPATKRKDGNVVSCAVGGMRF